MRLQTLLLIGFLPYGAVAQNSTNSQSVYTGNHQTQAPVQTEPTTIIRTVPVFDVGCAFGGAGQQPQGEYESRAAMLDKHGPYFAPVFSMSNFSVMGFVRGEWPIVIDYQLEEDALVLAIIAPEGAEPLLYRLPSEKGHWQQKVTIPAGVGPTPRVAHYTLRAMAAGGSQAGVAHLHVHGIAAGPKAVGSLGIDTVDFGPGPIHVANHENARFKFHSLFDFKNTEVDFIRLANANGEIIAASVGRKQMGSVTANQSREGSWDGRSSPESDIGGYAPSIQQWLRAPTGQHLMQVRAWWGQKDGGDWVSAISENLVTVE